MVYIIYLVAYLACMVLMFRHYMRELNDVSKDKK